MGDVQGGPKGSKPGQTNSATSGFLMTTNELLKNNAPFQICLNFPEILSTTLKETWLYKSAYDIFERKIHGQTKPSPLVA